MPSVLATVAEKVKDLLVVGQAAEAFSTDITPGRAYEVMIKLEDAGTVHCDVMPAAALTTAKRGNLFDYDVTVEVVVRYGFTDDDTVDATGKITAASVDALVLLVEEINEYLARRANRTLATVLAGWRGSEVVLPWEADHLRIWRQFTGLVRVTYTAEIDIS